jgi:beta-phosphoglucomutase
LPIKGVAFDLEGTVVDVEIAHHEGFLYAVEKLEGINLTMEEAIKGFPAFVGGGDYAVIKEILATRGLASEENIEKVRLEKMAYYNDRLKTLDCSPRPGALETITWLKKNGYKVAIASLTPKEQAKVLFEKSGIDRHFDKDCIILLEDVKSKKPAADVYLKTAERMGIKPAEQLAFEDSKTGITAAKAAGSLAIGMPVYDRSAILSALIENGASRIFWDWREMDIEAVLASMDKILEQ